MRTPRRQFRCEDELWERGVAKAKRQGTTLSAVMRGLLIRWLAEPED